MNIKSKLKAAAEKVILDVTCDVIVTYACVQVFIIDPVKKCFK